MTKGTVDFGASDMPMTDDMLNSSKVKLVHIPTVLGAVVPVFNVPGVTDIRFSGETLADIYLGKIANVERPGRLPRTTPAFICPTRRSSLFIAPMAAAPASSSPTT